MAQPVQNLFIELGKLLFQLDSLDFFPTVDLLATVGLRDSNLPSSDAIEVNGPNDKLDAFRLQRQLVASIESKELELIAALLPSQFGLYTVFNTLEYTGSIISITNGDDSTPLLDITLEVSDTVPDTNSLKISLRGLDFTFDLPTASQNSPFQNIGIKLMDSVLVLTLNCTIVDFVILRNRSDAVALTDARVSIFGEDAVVSLIAHIMC